MRLAQLAEDRERARAAAAEDGTAEFMAAARKVFYPRHGRVGLLDHDEIKTGVT